MWYLPGWRLLCGSEGEAQGLKRDEEPWGHGVGYRRRDGREWCSLEWGELWQMHFGVCDVKLSLGEAEVCAGEFQFWFSLSLTPWRSAVEASPLLHCEGFTLPKTNAAAISSLLFYQ